QLRVRLCSDEERVLLPGQLDVLHQLAIRGEPGEHQTGLLQQGAIGVVDLEAVTVAFENFPLSLMDVVDQGILHQFGRMTAQAHTATHVALTTHDVDLVGHGRDDRFSRLVVELDAVGTLQPGHVARVLDHHRLQTEAHTHQRDLVLTRVTDRAVFALYATRSETTGHKDTVDIAELGGSTGGGGTVVTGHPANIDPGVG